ncbi:MAG: hypothetical protein WAL25_01970, partial [Acidimicrobiia bacterium]
MSILGRIIGSLLTTLLVTGGVIFVVDQNAGLPHPEAAVSAEETISIESGPSDPMAQSAGSGPSLDPVTSDVSAAAVTDDTSVTTQTGGLSLLASSSRAADRSKSGKPDKASPPSGRGASGTAPGHSGDKETATTTTKPDTATTNDVAATTSTTRATTTTTTSSAPTTTAAKTSTTVVSGGVRVSPGTDLQQMVDSHPSGTTFVLETGTHRNQRV